MPDGESNDYDSGIVKVLKDVVSSGYDIYSDVGGLSDNIINYRLSYRYLNDALLEYSKKYHNKVSLLFDMSVFSLEELAYILSDYQSSMTYIDAFENGLKESGISDDKTYEAIDLLRTEYSEKFIGVALDLREECLEYGSLAAAGAMDVGVTVGKLTWDIVFTVTGVNNKGENLKLFYGVYCVDDTLNRLVSNKINYDKPKTPNDIAQFRSLWSMLRAEKITAYKAMKEITNWYNKDSKQYADEQINELTAITYRLFQ